MINLTPTFQNSAREKIKDATRKGNMSFEDNDIKFNIVKCTGHARPLDLIKIINLISPKLLVPIHSYRPEKL